ncbi:MAG: Holliday junction branch migration protein RuvA, partial [Sulfuricaulis sp.]|nr:Holliday junction branch migration protein RuvA [Sulfuricaulis sp.]
LSDEEFCRCVAEEDIVRLTKVPGIGRKTAERLVIEMRDKLPKDIPMLASTTTAAGPVAPGDPVSEAVSALVALGYKPNEASRAVRSASTKGLSAEEIIRQALKGMAG